MHTGLMAEPVVRMEACESVSTTHLRSHQLHTRLSRALPFPDLLSALTFYVLCRTGKEPVKMG